MSTHATVYSFPITPNLLVPCVYGLPCREDPEGKAINMLVSIILYVFKLYIDPFIGFTVERNIEGFDDPQRTVNVHIVFSKLRGQWTVSARTIIARLAGWKKYICGLPSMPITDVMQKDLNEFNTASRSTTHGRRDRYPQITLPASLRQDLGRAWHQRPLTRKGTTPKCPRISESQPSCGRLLPPIGWIFVNPREDAAIKRGVEAKIKAVMQMRADDVREQSRLMRQIARTNARLQECRVRLAATNRSS